MLNAAVIKVAHGHAVCAFGPYAYRNGAGSVFSCRKSADYFYLPHIFLRTVKFVGVKALYSLRVYIIAYSELSETEIEYAKIGIVKQHRRRYKVKKEYEPRKLRKYNRRNNRRGGGYAKIQPWKIKKS